MSSNNNKYTTSGDNNTYTDLENLDEYWKYTYRRAGLGFNEA